jgi:adenine phosphoribosyltransferase
MNDHSKTPGNGFDLDKAIRKIKDFPKPGILFYDITSIPMNPDAFDYCIGRMIEYYGDKGLSAIAAVESRGFLFAAPFASRMRLPIVLLRKKGKLPGETYSANFTLEYGEDTIEVHKADLKSGMRVLIVDDLIATGGTLKAACSLIERAGAEVSGIFAVIGLPFLNYDESLGAYDVKTLIDYHGE